MPDTVRPADPEAMEIARGLMQTARHAALAYTDAETGTLGISRIAFGLAPAGGPVTLISALSPHFAALRARTDCALLVGEPGLSGDPLTHPRLMIQAKACFVATDHRASFRARWLADHPKAKLYIDFADFAFVTFDIRAALLNAGFGRAYRIPPDELS